MPSNRKPSGGSGLQLPELLADERNLELLRLLRENPRQGTSELARRVLPEAHAIHQAAIYRHRV